jgi:RNA 2',3'-cyclic 3'-phosphodiesterase
LTVIEGFTLRLFFALWPDACVRAQIADAAAGLRIAGAVRPVPPENFHLTLAFVGEVPISQLAVLQQIGGAERTAAGCMIKLDAYEFWPEPKVVVAAARETPAALIELWTRLHRAITRVSVPLRPPAPLRAHVTLARKIAQAPVLQAMSPIYWRARSFSLVRSDMSAARSVYTVVGTWPLLDELPNQ